MRHEQERVLREGANVDRHAHGDEKQAHQQPFVRFHAGFDLDAVARCREHHPDQERSQRHGHAGMFHGAGGNEYRRHGGQQESLAVVAACQMIENSRQQVAATKQHQGNHGHRPGQLLPQRQAGRQRSGVRENRHQRQ